jgi:hypothetical protein
VAQHTIVRRSATICKCETKITDERRTSLGLGADVTLYKGHGFFGVAAKRVIAGRTGI